MGGRSRETTTTSIDPDLGQFFREDVFPGARDIFNTPFEGYTGDRVAAVSPLAMGSQTYYDRVGDISRMTPQDYAAMTAANMTPYQSQVVDATLNRLRREEDVQRTREAAEITAAGAFGNERRGVYEAEREAARDVNRDQLVANLMQQGYSQAQAATMGQLSQAQQAALAAAGGMTQLGNLQQATTQAGLDAEYEEFLRRINDPLMRFGALTTAAGGFPASAGTVATTSKPGFIDYLGAFASLGQGYGAMRG